MQIETIKIEQEGREIVMVLLIFFVTALAHGSTLPKLKVRMSAPFS